MLRTWIIRFLTGDAHDHLMIGSRVKTPFGPGTVKGGCVHVLLDPGHKPANHGPTLKQVAVSTSLDVINY